MFLTNSACFSQFDFFPELCLFLRNSVCFFSIVFFFLIVCDFLKFVCSSHNFRFFHNFVFFTFFNTILCFFFYKFVFLCCSLKFFFSLSFSSFCCSVTLSSCCATLSQVVVLLSLKFWCFSLSNFCSYLSLKPFMVVLLGVRYAQLVGFWRAGPRLEQDVKLLPCTCDFLRIRRLPW